jgi:hypothetical protein
MAGSVSYPGYGSSEAIWAYTGGASLALEVPNRGWNRSRAESRGVGTAARVGGRSKLWKDTIGFGKQNPVKSP